MKYPTNVNLTPTEKKNLKNFIKVERAAAEVNARKQNAGPDNGILGNVFGQGNGPYNSAPLSNPWQMNYDNNYAPISLNRILLTYLYSTQGVVQRVVDQPIEDGLRGGLEYSSDELDTDDLELFENYMDYFILPQVKSGMKWRELFGGAGLIINTDQNPTSNLDPDAITDKTPFALIPADRWELTLNYVNYNAVECPFNYYGQSINQTRVIMLKGKEAPSFMRQRLQGWGMSVVERLMRDLQMYTKEQDVIFELIDEAKIDVVSIEGYNASILNGNAQGMIGRRMLDVSMGKNYHNMIVLDKEDTYEQKQLTFAGLADILTQIRIGMAAACQMPVTKLFGLSAAGFNSGEDDLENYNSMVESEVRGNLRRVLLELIPLVARQVFGYPAEIKFDFKPLRVLSETEEENIKTTKLNRLSVLYSQGILNDVEYCEELKKAGILNMETEVARGIRKAEPPEPATRVDVPQEPAKPPKKDNSRRRSI